MKHQIFNADDYCGWRFENQGDLAIVFEGPYAKAQAPDPLVKEVWEGLEKMDVKNRLASIYVVCAYHKEKGKEKYPLRELRAGWRRVQAELSFIPSVKRILLVSQSSLLTQVVMPGVPGLPDTHGSIFTLASGLEVVPTWHKTYEHMRQWKNTDIERWKWLQKEGPLPYHHSIKGLKSHHKKIIVDLETSGLVQVEDHITVLGVQWSDKDRALISGTPNVDWCIKKLCQHVREGAHIYFHNGQFDLGFMGQEFRDVVTNYNAVHCTMIRARARGELVNTLKHLGNVYTNRPGNYSHARENEEHDFTDPKYVCEDLEVTWQLSNLFKHDDIKPVVQQFEQCIVMAAEQSIAGSFVNRKKLMKLHEDGIKNIEFWKAECLKEYGVDPGKTQELIPILLERGHKLTAKTPSGAYKLDEDVCEEHGLESILQYRKAVKLDSSFVGKLTKLIRQDDTVPHSQTMIGAETGRTTMTRFNWQQAAKKGPVRDLVCSRFPGGFIIIVDLAQAELRVLAYVSNDEVYAELFEKEDPHLSNASRAFDIPECDVTEDLRFDAKSVIFKVVYGGKAVTPGQKRVEKFYRSTFRKAFLWIDAIAIFAKQKLEITDAYGKTRNLKEVETWRGLSGVARAGINSPIQGIASHISMQVTYNVWRLFRKYKLRSKVLFGVHDSAVADIHPDEIEIAIKLFRLGYAQLRDSHMMVFPLAKTLPMQGELLIGESWGWIDANKKQIIKNKQHVMCSSLDPITEDSLCIAFAT